MSLHVRPARPDDVPHVLAMVRELARHEKAEHEVVATEVHFREALFCSEPQVFCHVAEREGELAGFALWFVNFSTWLGRHGVYLEDLYVKPAARRLGVGRALIGQLARVCLERGYGRLDFAVLDWNEPGCHFYDALGVKRLHEWTPFRFEGEALRALVD